jgi:hypothetical protein
MLRLQFGFGCRQAGESDFTLVGVQPVDELPVCQQVRANPRILAQADRLLLPTAGSADLNLIAESGIADCHPDAWLAWMLPAGVGRCQGVASESIGLYGRESDVRHGEGQVRSRRSATPG